MKKPIGYLIYIILFSVFLGSCGDPQSEYDSIETEPINLTKMMEVEGGDQLLIGNINQLEITENGSMLLLDTQQKKIHIFDENGNFMKSALSEGEGPGEVREVGQMDYSNGMVQVFDWSQRKLSQFRLESDIQDGEARLVFAEDFRPQFYPNDFHISPENVNHVLVDPVPIEEDGMIKIQPLSKDGELVGEPILTFTENETIEIRNEQGQLLVTFSSPHSRQIIPVFHGNKLYLARSEQIGFEIYDLSTGNQIDSVAFKRPGFALASGEKREFLEGMTARMGMGGVDISMLIPQMPDVKGKVRNMHYDPIGILWLNLIDDDTDKTPEWLIISEDGELLGRVPGEFAGPVMAVNSGKVYVRESTEEGVQFMSIYEYEIPQ